MSRLRLGLRLVVRDLRRRAPETVLLFVGLAVAATTMTIGLVLHGQTAVPYDLTRQRTQGPDVVVTLLPAAGKALTATDRAHLQAVVEQPEVVAHSEAFPMTPAAISAHGVSGVAEVQGRDTTASAVDRPRIVSGGWVSPGGVVVERAFAQAMEVSVGDRVRLGDRRVTVVGIAVSAALPPYPQLCTLGCDWGGADMSAQPGLVWATRNSVPVSTELVQYLRLRDPETAAAFASHYDTDGPPQGQPEATDWRLIGGLQDEQLASERTVVIFGGSLLVVLALATLVVLVGGRMSEEAQRVGMLKAAGAGPAYVAGVLLASYLAVGVAATVVGLVAGRLLTPRLVSLSTGLLGHVGPTSVTATDTGLVAGAVLALVVCAVAVPAWRAARTSTVRALADAGRTYRRHRALLAFSARLPATAILGLRLAARRLRRTALTGLSVAVVACGVTVVLYARATMHAERHAAGAPADPQAAQTNTVMTALTVLLAVMAAITLLFVARASAVDARRPLAVSRALGLTPGQAAAGLGVAQLFPALVGLVVGGVVGSTLFHALASASPTRPSALQLLTVAVLILVLTVALSAVPAGLESRRPIPEVLRMP